MLEDRIAIMSARPGTIKSVFENRLPRPRKLEMQLTGDYLALKKRYGTF